MTTGVVAWRVLGRHRTSSSVVDDAIDGVDLALELADGTVRAFGLRTPELFLDERSDEGWDDGYEPIRTDLDPSTVEYWSFDQVLWLGPEPDPCVVWTNAAALSVAGLRHLFEGRSLDALLKGRDGRGLPLLERLGRAPGRSHSDE